ncbi:MAG: UvrABC system protein A [Firmicutes bacterium ADurb.Bin193]|nr:MAG: UvrABC system protein A [Firmicutes bacterium ADurb.Bin193]
MDKILIKGAREHNLKNIDVEIPRDKLVVITGLSGSGKSSLAFDTIYAEGQRRYMESLSSYARQFLGQMNKPDLDYIEGLSPAISIDQKTTSKNPRSTVGTVTEIYDYLRLLYARVGHPHCPNCGKEISQQTIDQIVDRVLSLPEGTRLQVLAPVVRGKKGEHTKIFEDAKKSGYVRVRVDGIMYEVSEEINLEKTKKHNIELVIDRLIVKPDIKARLTDSLETAMHQTGGLVIVELVQTGEELIFSQDYACHDCGISMEELTPRMFSFNNPYGACPQCTGLGFQLKIDVDLVIPDKTKSLNQGAICTSGWNSATDDTMSSMYFKGLAEHYGFSLDTPVKDLPKEAVDVLLYGTNGKKIRFSYDRSFGKGTYFSAFEGVINNLERRHRETTSDWMRAELESLMTATPCPECGGARLKKEVLAVTVGGKNIDSITHLPVSEVREFFRNLKLTQKEKTIAERILKEINERLGFLENVGLEYLTLSRPAGTLSGGEAQRIRLATQIGSSLMGVLYILDEPSIGLHQRDNAKLLSTLRRLRDLGNTLIVVEHDEETMYAADHIIDIGPGAGVHGGYIIAQGGVEDIKKCEISQTGLYLSGKKRIEVPEKRHKGNGQRLKIIGARENNLKNIDVSIPLGTMCCVTGVSGSGKSSLINEILYKRLASELNGAKKKAGRHDDIVGVDHLDKVINIDQSPIGRTPRSNPATYTGLFGEIRELYASTNEAKLRGYKAGRFSFNVKGGRCEACEGDGIIKIEMHFLPDVYVPCEVCKGKRYNRETLEVHYKGKNIDQVLNMTVEEGLSFFENVPRIQKKLQTLYEVGLGYIKIGQPSTTLSGGEAQRVKLATELSKRSTGRTIYILDEPTTGLHMYDVHRLIDVLQRLVDGGNTVVIIEHNLDVIKTADYVIDLGPEGGDKGGFVIVSGTPEEVAKHKSSYTGQYLKDCLDNKRRI